MSSSGDSPITPSGDASRAGRVEAPVGAGSRRRRTPRRDPSERRRRGEEEEEEEPSSGGSRRPRPDGSRGHRVDIRA